MGLKDITSIYAIFNPILQARPIRLCRDPLKNSKG